MRYLIAAVALSLIFGCSTTALKRAATDARLAGELATQVAGDLELLASTAGGGVQGTGSPAGDALIAAALAALGGYGVYRKAKGDTHAERDQNRRLRSEPVGTQPRS